MRIEQFEVKQLDELMLFLDESLNENYERVVFLNIRKRWPEGFLTVIDNEKIVGVACGAILPKMSYGVYLKNLKELRRSLSIIFYHGSHALCDCIYL